MAVYRKKPILIEAIQYEGRGNFVNSQGKLPNWIWKAFEDQTLVATNGLDPLLIKTLEGDLYVAPLDWIIKGIKDELYPCKPDIFEATYEPYKENT